MNSVRHFNSTLVRLKGPDGAIKKTFITYFNSTLVRLKVPIDFDFAMIDLLFQFHFGAIKSVRYLIACAGV